MKKRILTAVLVMVMAVLMITPALAVVEPTDSFYVADYANVLSDATEQEIIEANGVLENTCNGAQIVVVAVEYLDGMYSDEYALQVMNEWGVGDANKNNGMVLVFATKENKGWLMTGDGIDAYFTDNMADEYLNDYFWGHFDNGQYDRAVQNLFPELIEWYEDHYDARVYGGVYNEAIGEPVYHPEPEPYVDYSWIIFVVIFFAFFILIAILGSRQRYRSYYVHMGMPVPRFHIWHMWSGPHRHWHDPHRPRHHHHSGPRGPHGPSGFGGGFGGGAGRGGSGGFGGMGRGGGGRSGGGGGGRR